MPEREAHLTVAVSSSALFDLAESDKVYREQGLEEYRRYQIEHENEVLAPGAGFRFVEKLLRLNETLGKRRVDVILLSRNSADTGLRVFNSIREHALDVVRAAFTSGKSPYRYAKPFKCDLFLSADAGDVRGALDDGIAAATLLNAATDGNSKPELRIAFDGDAVLFSDDAERVNAERGLDAFTKAESQAADQPLDPGPFEPFVQGLHRLQREFDDADDCPIRTALITARGAPADERVIKTLRAWQIRLDECLFLAGREKGEFLRAYEADVFFDDQSDNCDEASSHVVAGHVPSGVHNEPSDRPPDGGSA